MALGVDPVDKLSLEDAVAVINTNVMGLIALTRLFLPGMKERENGHVVNLGSVAGHEAYDSGSLYNVCMYVYIYSYI